MKKYFLVAILLFSVQGFSQNQGSIKGSVIDKEMYNEPLLFANVELKDTNHKTESNFKGNFEFTNLENGEYTLLVSYVGYETVEVPVLVESNKVAHVNLGMQAKTFDFSEVSAKSIPVKEKLTSSTGLE